MGCGSSKHGASAAEDAHWDALEEKVEALEAQLAAEKAEKTALEERLAEESQPESVRASARCFARQYVKCISVQTHAFRGKRASAGAAQCARDPRASDGDADAVGQKYGFPAGGLSALQNGNQEKDWGGHAHEGVHWWHDWESGGGGAAVEGGQQLTGPRKSLALCYRAHFGKYPPRWRLALKKRAALRKKRAADAAKATPIAAEGQPESQFHFAEVPGNHSSKGATESETTKRTSITKQTADVMDLEGSRTNDVTVVARVRPFLSGECNDRCLNVIGETVLVKSRDGAEEVGRPISFDAVVGMDDKGSQLVFNHTGKSAAHEVAMRGVSAIVFAFGQTGSGKTYTLLGGKGQDGVQSDGVASMSYNALSDALKERAAKESEGGSAVEYEVQCSILQVYLGGVYDLLGKDSEAELRIHSRTKPTTLTEAGGETCELSPKETILPCRDAKEFSNVLAKGMGRRVARSTNKNATSSRSHCIVTLLVRRVTKLKGQASGSGGREHMARLVLVDLAGNERDSARNDAEGEKLLRDEGINVNKSLTALGKVLRMRSSAKPLPVGGASRDSALTRLLKEPLTSAKIFFIACVSPVASDSHTSALTLGYAEQVKKIKTNAEDSAVLLEKGLNLYPMEFIPHDALEKRGAIPRSHEGKTVYLNELRSAVLRFFISHRWLDGNRKPAHPDMSREGHPKHELICMAIEKMKAAGWINLSDRLDIVDWIDFACVDQDSANPAEQLNASMGKIIGSCDVMITPIYDPEWRKWSKAGAQENINDPFTDYGAEPFQDYLGRGWCRLEMFFNANMPFNKGRERHFDGELRKVMTQERRRPHVIFGTRELRLGLEPLILPKLQDDKFKDWNPGKGKLSSTKDRDVIGRYVNELLQINSNLRPRREDDRKEKELPALERAKEMVSKYTGEGEVLSKEEYRDMVRAILSAEPVDVRYAVYHPKELVLGVFKHAADRIYSLMNVNEDDIVGKMMHNQGLKAMEEEVEKLGSEEVSELLRYILYEPSSEKRYPYGIRDYGRNGMRLADFVEHKVAVEAGLNEAEVAALRLYTTIAYKVINNPLRDQERNRRKKPHPLPVTTALIDRAIKKLQRFGADDGSDAVKTVMMYRGMRDIVAGDDFIKMGGTELAPMSTTPDISTAVSYSMSPETLIFRIVTTNQLQRGVDLQWVSAFAGADEVLYPPLTFLQPTGRSQVVELDGMRFTVVEVNPLIA